MVSRQVRRAEEVKHWRAIAADLKEENAELKRQLERQAIWGSTLPDIFQKADVAMSRIQKERDYLRSTLEELWDKYSRHAPIATISNGGV